MSDTQSWYQRRIAQARTQVSTFRAQPAPPPAATYIQPQYPQQQMFQPEVQQQVALERTTIANLYEQAGKWRGGPGAKANPNPCPQCGSNQFFSRAGVSKRLPPPAPHCYNCGYNDGMFEQGLASAWGATG